MMMKYMTAMSPPWRQRFEPLKTLGFVASPGPMLWIAAFLPSAGVIHVTLVVSLLAIVSVPDARCSGRYANPDPTIASPYNTGELSGPAV